MKAILIDPVARTVNEVEYNGDWKTIGPMIGADLFGVTRLTNSGDSVYYDDEGLLREDKDEIGTFALAGLYGGTLTGKCLILGTDAEGDSTAPKTLTVEDIVELVEWGLKAPEPSMTFHPMTDEQMARYFASGELPDNGEPIL